MQLEVKKRQALRQAEKESSEELSNAREKVLLEHEEMKRKV